MEKEIGYFTCTAHSSVKIVWFINGTQYHNNKSNIWVDFIEIGIGVLSIHNLSDAYNSTIVQCNAVFIDNTVSSNEVSLLVQGMN